MALHGLLSTGKYAAPTASRAHDSANSINENALAQAVDHAACVADRFMARFYPPAAAKAAEGEER